jgi:hypothetical protein
LQSGVPPKIVDLPASELENKTGAYINTRNGAVWRISAKDGKLIANGRGGDFQFSPLSETRFLSTQFQVMTTPVQAFLEFKKSSKDLRWTATLTIGAQEPITLEPADLVTLTEAQLAQYVGDYFSEELQATYKLRLEGSKLVIKDHPVFDQAFKATTKDSFVNGGPSFKFDRDDRDRISGFTLNLAMQHMRIPFVKVK